MEGDSTTDEPVRVVFFSNLTTKRTRKLLERLLIGEEAGEGLSEAADGLSFGLIVGQASS